MLGQHQTCNINTIKCLLCLNEKQQITTYQATNMLNKRTEIINQFMHRIKYTIESYDNNLTS